MNVRTLRSRVGVLLGSLSVGVMPLAAPCGAQVSTPAAAASDGVRVTYPEYPAVSPDGSLISFSWAGDIWITSSLGGVATRLTTHPANERRSTFSPDGSLLAFESDRDGVQDAYVMPLVRTNGRVVGGPVTRITTSDVSLTLSTFTADGRGLLLTSSMRPAIHREYRMYRVPIFAPGGELTGELPIEPLTEAFGLMPAAAGDGSERYVFIRNYPDPFRPKYRGTASPDVYLYDASVSGDAAFTRLTAYPGNDAQPHLLPDGSVVFLSSRDGQNNVYRLPPGKTDLDPGSLIQLTDFAPASGELTIGHGVRDLGVSRDGTLAVFAVWNEVYTLDLTQPAHAAAPRPISLFADADTNQLEVEQLDLSREVSEAVLSPDGKSIAMIARGEVFVRAVEEGRPTRRVTATAARERDLAWSPDGRYVYFCSDERGMYEVRAASVSLSREDLRAGAEPKKDADAKKETEEPATPDFGAAWAGALEFETVTVVASDDGEDRRTPRPSPDGLQLLYVRGSGDLLLATLAEEGGATDARVAAVSGEPRLIRHGWNIESPIWAGDSRHVLFASDDLDFNGDIWLGDTAADEPMSSAVNITRHPDNDGLPRLSADGKVLVFVSERAGENNEYDVWGVFLDKKLEGLTAYELDEYFKKAAKDAAKRTPLKWTKREQEKAPPEAVPDPSGEQAKVEQVETEPETKVEERAQDAAAQKPEDEKKDAPVPAAEEKKPAAPVFEFDAEDAYLRVRRLTSLPGAEFDVVITPGGDRVVFTMRGEGEARDLMSVDHRGEDRKTLQTGGKCDQISCSLTGDKVVYVKGGQAFAIAPTGGKTDSYPIVARVRIDVQAQQRQKFLEAARIIGNVFYHPTMKDLDWAALTERYLELALGTRSPAAFNRVVRTLLGELDASHMGIAGGDDYEAPAPRTGHLGIERTSVPGGYRVDRVIDGSPADADWSRLRAGDVLVSVEGRRLAPSAEAMPTVDLGAAMLGRAGLETLVELRRDGETRHVVIVPVTFREWNQIAYADEVRRRRAEVDRLSGGTLGYLHLAEMNEPQIREFERDLYAAAAGKKGLVIDVRDNTGGWTADVLLASLTAPAHAFTVPHGVDPAGVPHDAYPRDRRLIFGYSRPISVIINHRTYSNGEIFAHAIKTIERGRLVGEATFGGVISTGSATLIDGSTIRLPGRGWYLPDGTDMENHGAGPDVPVEQTPADEAGGRDPQLEAAVKELMERVK